MKLFKPNIELVVIRDIFNPTNNIECYKGRDIELLLKQAFGDKGLSENVHLYHNDITNDVTPKTADDVDKILRLNGRIYAVVRPMGLDPVSWFIIGVSVLVSVAAAFFLMPQMPNMGGSNQPPSPNNALSARRNTERLGGRIPDIYGTVWSVPDLIAPVYSVYIDHEEVEYSFMCIGRGRFNVMKAYDDTSDVTQIEGTTVQIYEPNSNISTANPVKQFGANMTAREKVLSKLAVKRYTAVNGQILKSPEVIPLSSSGSFVFTSPNIVDVSGYGVSLSGAFSVGQSISLSTVGRAKSIGIREGETAPRTFNFSGTYTIGSISGNRITLVNPQYINSDWAIFQENIDYTVPVNGSITNTSAASAGENWEGWFYTDDPDSDGIMINFVAPNGIYTVFAEGDKFVPFGVKIAVETEQVDENGIAIAGTTQTEYRSVDGRGAIVGSDGKYTVTTDDEARRSAAATHFFYRSGRHRVRVRRYSKENVPNPPQQYFEEIKIKDLYSYTLIADNKSAAANSTRVYVKTLATEGALSVKERKLRLLVQKYVKDATSGLPKLSNRADDIIRDIAQDPKIGNLSLNQIDIAQIKTEVNNIVSYFGTEKCAEFCYTFDDNNLSTEESLQTVGKAIFSQLKRQGNKIMLDFERVVPASVAVFNSHNILPDTYTAPQSFGVANDWDGVSVEYRDPIDDAAVTLAYPNMTTINPHEDKLIGVRNKVQAHMHMKRIYNRDQYTYKSCEFTAGDESNIVVRTNRVTVAEQLRASVQQGSVESIVVQGGNIIMQTSDPVEIGVGSHTAFIQTINNGVEAIAVTANDDYSVKLARLPSGEISTGYDAVVQAVYQIVSNDDIKRDAYLVAEKSPSEGMTNKLICTNYDDRYYQNDKDFINGLIALN